MEPKSTPFALRGFVTGAPVAQVCAMAWARIWWSFSVYALLRERATLVSRLALAASVFLVYLRPSWLFWSALLLVLARPHPPTLHDSRPVGRGRVVVGLIGLAVFVVCFTPEPIMISWADFLQAWREVL